MVNTVTPRQVDLLKTLQEEREISHHVSGYLIGLRDAYRQGLATSRAASSVIDELLRCPKKDVQGTIEVGIYEMPDGRLFRAYFGQNRGKVLCKSIHTMPGGDIYYEYQGLACRFLQGARRLTREEVSARTLSCGATSCMLCGRRLDDPESVDRGIGPVCWENYG